MNQSNNTKRRALVTGATGYIGSHLVKHLIADGWDVHVIVRSRSKLDGMQSLEGAVTVHQHDGTTRNMISLVAAAAPDTVFHLASLFLAQHQSDDLEALLSSNLLFSTQLVEGMVACGVKRMVNTGTSWQHYQNEEYRPVNLYAATKQAFEVLLAYYVDAHELKVTTVALFDTYGQGDPRPKLVALLWKTAATQVPLSMSPGEQMIDLVHIDDVVAAFLAAASSLHSQELGHTRYGVSSGSPLKLKELVASFQRATGLSLPIAWGERAYRPREVMVLWDKFLPPPGWRARVSFETGIVQTNPSLQSKD